MGILGMIGLYYSPSIARYTMETSKALQPSIVKPYFYNREYLERVAKLKEHWRTQRRAGNRKLSYDDKLLIYTEYLSMIQERMNELYEEKDRAF